MVEIKELKKPIFLLANKKKKGRNMVGRDFNQILYLKRKIQGRY